MVPKAISAVAALYHSYKFKVVQTNWPVHVCSAQVAAVPQAGTRFVPSNTILDVDFRGVRERGKEPFWEIGSFAVHIVDKWS